MAQLRSHGLLSSDDHPAGMRLAALAACRGLLNAAGLRDIEMTTKQLGYHLKDESQWWDVLWNSGARGWIERIPPAQRERFKSQHLAEMRSLCGDRGLWLDVETHFAGGAKP